MPVDEYAELTNTEYNSLLSSDPPECEMQTFLEKHPWLVPGALTPSGSSGHSPLHCSLIAQPKLPGADLHFPDFMWIAKHSGAWFPTLIEIESPRKRIFTNTGDVPRADFTQARHQLEKWRVWFRQPNNIQNFMQYYGIPQQLQNLPMCLHMILVYGRRLEFHDNPKLERERAGLLTNSDAELMSFDRLRVDETLRDAITVKAIGDGMYKAKWIPPIFQLGPAFAERLQLIDGIPEAISEDSLISETRKEFLRRRVPYWESWASSGGKGIINPGHVE